MTDAIDYTDPGNTEALIRALSDRHGGTRQQTREALARLHAVFSDRVRRAASETE